MLVNQNNKVLVNANGKVVINDPINEFLGTVSDLWNNPANWSLGVLPNANQIAVIRADCVVNVSATVRTLVVDVTSIINLSGSIITTDLLNLGAIVTNGANFTVLGNNFTFGNYTSSLPTSLTFAFDGDLALPSDQSLYVASLFIGSLLPSTKSLTANTNIKGNLTVRWYASNPDYVQTIFDLTGFDLIVDGATYLGQSSLRLGKLKRSNALGKTVFKGAISTGQNAIIFDNCLGHEVEFWNGVLHTINVVSWGDAKCIFKMNNQNYSSSTNGAIMRFVEIDTIKTTIITNSLLIVTESITGLFNGELIIQSNATLAFRGNSTPSENLFDSGILTLELDSRVSYDLDGNQYIKAISYEQLGICTSGVKYLKGNVTCNHLYFAGKATLDLNGFTITGYTKYTDSGTVARYLPSGVFEEITLSGGGIKTLTGNIIVMGTYSRTGGVIINKNGFTIKDSLGNDLE